ncbi:MAG: hypothetical protein EOM35_02190 [Negativicutes bacterium]|nr:hypothetical protein [Negativicutes bacterium]
MVDITRLRKNSEKKSVSVSAAEIKAADIASTALHELFNLPPDALIVNAGVVVETAGQANLTVDFGFDGGYELMNDVDIDDTGYKQNTLVVAGTAADSVVTGTATVAPRILTGTGRTVTAKFSAVPTAGVFHFIVEYIEYKLGNGMLTQLGDG